MLFNERLDEFARELGADFVGVADLSSAHEAIEEQGGERIAAYPRAISIGIVLLDTIIDELPHRCERCVAVSYQHAYDVTNLRLDLITSRLSNSIQKDGYKALPIPASERCDDERICAVFSNKMAAHLAGLGWIGKSCLLITPEAGPRVRWATVLTDAPLSVTGEPMEERCGKCTDCMDICPVSAFTGRNFREDEPREARYNARKCEEYFEDMRKTGSTAVCGLCVYVCPHGQKQK
ncbi:4Fe-4S double cluster binding domain-containing protein [Methanobacterium paludis]|uniref:4Fe-4S ferredoxin iron-sulfur binding domain-containing protein n=1 Tax=Methanobacterium paludis (strain DSM 25820 / JCM 18151 / SWAN1) TaxID=868131 RepID=F6D4K9_METPW|nr:4Fe-4S double cluster binding domain-containing protein [Methanobacterium paludis]AEG19249.1 4Fe-4S ferredoxin iron-sulfur binding domain-containing protein [Methanobacterium paludis]